MEKQLCTSKINNPIREEGVSCSVRVEENTNVLSSRVIKIAKGVVSTQSCDMALHRELRRELSNVVVKSLDREINMDEEKPVGRLGLWKNKRNIGYKSALERWLCPFDLLPSCLGILRGSKIKNLLEAKYGIGKSSREGTFVMEWANGPSNTKLMIMYASLNYYQRKGKTESYWATVDRLFRMNEFWIACLNVVFPSWESKEKYEDVIEWVKGARQLAETPTQQLPNMVSKRVYIPKRKAEPLGLGNARPLGVPSPVWRIYLRGMNNAVMFWNKGKLTNQYAYQKGKDVTDAWVQILELLDEYEHCYEFDLTGFFDNVTHAGIRQELQTLKFPEEIIERLIKLSQNVPEFGLPKDDLMPEPDRKVRYLPDGKPNPGFVESPDSVNYKEVGVPQGGAISCGLAILANRQSASPLICKESGLVRIVNYFADDGIINSNKPITPGDVDDEFRGLRENISKGGLVKSSNLKIDEIKLKFLGLSLDKGEFGAKSRNGASLQLESKHYVYGWAKTHWNDIVRSVSLIHREKEKKERELWELQKTPEDLESILNQSQVDGENNSEIVVKKNKKSYRVKLPFKLLSERIEAEGYSMSVEKDIVEYLDGVGKSLNNKKGFKESLTHLLGSSEGGAIVSRLYSNSWEVPAEEEAKEEWGKGSWKLVRLGEFLRKRREQLVWKLPPNLGVLHSQSQKTLKELFKRILPNEEGKVDNYVGITLENASSFGCQDLLQHLRSPPVEWDYSRGKRITFYVAPPKIDEKGKGLSQKENNKR